MFLVACTYCGAGLFVAELVHPLFNRYGVRTRSQLVQIALERFREEL